MSKSAGLKIETVKDIFSLWSKDSKESLSCKVIIQRGKTLGLSRRTVLRYLELLKKAEQIKRDKKPGSKYTFYTPDTAAWNSIMNTFPLQWVSTGEMAKFHVISHTIGDKYDEVVDWDRDDFRTYESKSKIPKVMGKSVSPDNSKKLGRSICQLLDVLKESLAVDYLGGSTDHSALYGLLWDDITKVVSAYMDLWQFIYKTPGANDKFSEYLRVIEDKLKDFQQKEEIGY